ncbi:hypothetical protein A0J61_06194 [Choanephora cucurbitarum]|uniref:Uncharacterized protein n=1 Tax=Choanephora cucurbitarum TaxID=101091 RepID=A0A1C7N9E4_9FUNG|nr:hypothetical protein A0J61_06194 [Choanephora cucurbitarum]
MQNDDYKFSESNIVQLDAEINNGYEKYFSRGGVQDRLLVIYNIRPEKPEFYNFGGTNGFQMKVRQLMHKTDVPAIRRLIVTINVAYKNAVGKLKSQRNEKSDMEWHDLRLGVFERHMLESDDLESMICFQCFGKKAGLYTMHKNAPITIELAL